MDINGLLQSLFGSRHPRVDRQLAAQIELAPPLAKVPGDPEFRRLPELHQACLHASDGIDMLGSSYRLFGWDHGRRLRDWNAPDSWKFAWGERATGYYCIGESVLGNQFAYRLSELANPAKARVYELYAVTFDEICSFPDFAGFLVDGFLNGVEDDAYHRRIEQVRRATGGAFAADQHRAYMPSPLLAGGQVNDAQLVPMQARAHMTVNGDLFRELAHRDTLEGLYGLENYVDAKGRTRLRALWAPPSMQ